MIKSPWMGCASSLNLEWRQAKEEGRDVDGLKELCELITKKAADAADVAIVGGAGDEGDYNAIADKVLDKLLCAKTLPQYPYVEPSGYAEILAARPKNRKAAPTAPPPQGQLRDKLAGAWSGRVSGCLLGKPVEGVRNESLTQLLKLTNNYPMRKYIMKKDFNAEAEELMADRIRRAWADCIDGRSPRDDDTNYTVLALKLLETNGRDFAPGNVLDGWLAWMPIRSTFTAEFIAYRNAAMGMEAPHTATYHNPCREGIGAQIRADFFGYVNPGNPEKAAEMAWKDASVSHVKNGIYGEMFVAAMIAAAAVSSDAEQIVEAGLGEIPEQCRLRRDIDLVLKWYRDGLSADIAAQNIHKCYDEKSEFGWLHTNSNAMIVAMAVLYGGGDFGKSICLAVQTGYDTDCNGATVGSIVGMMVGAG
ncbi:MAG: ADP-ribosylglycohydrolase family protein, partial [Oscillospiraceae bacterium]|nr:ADP-ribosylglycohydrolase family protein [Oscillospiraceae bacterium]